MTQVTPLVDLSDLLDSILPRLFDVAAEIAPPHLVHPVLGRVETALTGMWPADPAGSDPAPARLTASRPLRTFLIGADASSEALGKFALLGLAVAPLQAAWRPAGDAIGEAFVQVMEDDSAAVFGYAAGATAFAVPTSAVEALWRLRPFAPGDDATAFAAAYAELMTAALMTNAADPQFQTAAAGRTPAELVTEARVHLTRLAMDWLTVVLALVRLRAAQQSSDGGRDYDADVGAVVDAYNDTKMTPAGSPFLAYVDAGFLGGHPSTAPLADRDASVDGGHFTDVLRSAVRFTDAGMPVEEDGGAADVPDAGVTPADPGNATLAAAFALADELDEYATDPADRWDDDKADCSSFVQRALARAGLARFDPGPGHGNSWTTYVFATSDDFVTMPKESARPGDILIQGGYRTAGGKVTWRAHCGIAIGLVASKPGLVAGVSMDTHGPSRWGLWGADPPGGYYAFGANLLVRRLRPTVLGASGAVVPDACPIEGGVRIRVNTEGLAAVTRIRAGGADLLDLTLDASGRYTYGTLPPASAGAADVVVTDATERVRTLPGAVRYVEDALTAARAVVAGHGVIATELIDVATELLARDQLTAEARDRLDGALNTRTAALDDGWLRRLHAAAPAGTAVLDAVFLDAADALTALWGRLRQILT